MHEMKCDDDDFLLKVKWFLNGAPDKSKKLLVRMLFDFWLAEAGLHWPLFTSTVDWGGSSEDCRVLLRLCDILWRNKRDKGRKLEFGRAGILRGQELLVGAPRDSYNLSLGEVSAGAWLSC